MATEQVEPPNPAEWTATDVTAYRTSSGAIRYQVRYQVRGCRPKEWLLTQPEALSLAGQLQRATPEPPLCHDCGSDMHGTGSHYCPQERDCDE